MQTDLLRALEMSSKTAVEGMSILGLRLALSSVLGRT